MTDCWESGCWWGDKSVGEKERRERDRKRRFLLSDGSSAPLRQIRILKYQ